MEGNVDPLDFDTAEEVLGWFLLHHSPALAIVPSRVAIRFAENVFRKYGISYTSTPHPGTPRAPPGGIWLPAVTVVSEAETCSPTS